MSFIEPSRPLPVLDDADVVVVGAGAGGVGAAISAARHGAKTILIERFGTLGGTWTSGLLGFIMVNWTARGIFEEYRQRLVQRGAWRTVEESWGYWGGDRPPEDSASYEATYDQETAKLVLDEMVAEAGVQVYYFAQVVHAFRSEDGKRVTAVAVQSKEGRHVITGKIFVDSSGDGDVGALAGAPFEVGRDGDRALQPMTMIFKMDGVDTERADAYLATDGGARKLWKLAQERGELTVPRDCAILHATPKPGVWSFNSTRLQGYDGTRLKDVSAATTEGRRQVAQVAAFMRKHVPGFEKALVSETAAHVGVRETRRFLCDYTITYDDIHGLVHFPDAIARGNWPVDVHSPNAVTTQVKPIRNGGYYTVPYRSITGARAGQSADCLALHRCDARGARGGAGLAAGVCDRASRGSRGGADDWPEAGDRARRGCAAVAGDTAERRRPDLICLPGLRGGIVRWRVGSCYYGRAGRCNSFFSRSSRFSRHTRSRLRPRRMRRQRSLFLPLTQGVTRSASPSSRPTCRARTFWRCCCRTSSIRRPASATACSTCCRWSQALAGAGAMR